MFDYTNTARIIRLPLWGWITIAIVWYILVLFGAVGKGDSLAPGAVVGFVLTFIFFINPLASLSKHEFDTSCLTMWFFCTTYFVYFYIKGVPRPDKPYSWPGLVCLLLFVSLTFSRYLYPHLRASWGGGAPANVTVYFSKDSLLNPNKPIQAQLIEESSEGIYIVGPTESKAIFIPRSAVAMIYFADKPADSLILQNTK